MITMPGRSRAHGGHLGASAGGSGPSLWDTREQRFNNTYADLMAKLAAVTKTTKGPAYDKAASQLAVLANLYVDCADFSPGADPTTASASSGQAQFQSPYADLLFLVNLYPLAFRQPGETLAEFATGADDGSDAAWAIRRSLWVFSCTGGSDGLAIPVWDGKFPAAVARVLLAATPASATVDPVQIIAQQTADIQAGAAATTANTPGQGAAQDAGAGTGAGTNNPTTSTAAIVLGLLVAGGVGYGIYRATRRR